MTGPESGTDRAAARRQPGRDRPPGDPRPAGRWASPRWRCTPMRTPCGTARAARRTRGRAARAAPADTYLRGDLLVDAALRTGADAVHPGYGFLSEDAGFAGRGRGRRPDLGRAAAGGHRGDGVQGGRQARWWPRPACRCCPLAAAESVPADAPYPLLVKASVRRGRPGHAGGPAPGRRWTTRWRRRGGRPTAAFGDGTVFVERSAGRSRHVEVQVLADTHGTVLALGDRECSVQRRHQKIVEEAPAPGLPDALRRRLREAAVAAARSVGYVGAGTVEFLVTPDGEPAFLEMNTRLQVEHPVTEAVLGLDLVALQIAVAEGRPLPFDAAAGADRARDRGPALRRGPGRRAGGRPPACCTGWRCRAWTPPSPPARCGWTPAWSTATTCSPHYDPMLAKVVAHAPARAAAARRLAAALAGRRVHGVATNRDLLVRVLRHPDFLGGGAGHRLPRPASRGARPARRPGRGASRRRWPRRWPRGPAPGRAAGAAHPAGRLAQQPRSQPATATYEGPGGRSRWPTGRRRRASSRRHPSGWCSTGTGCASAYRRARGRRGRPMWTVPDGRCDCPRWTRCRSRCRRCRPAR